MIEDYEIHTHFCRGCRDVHPNFWRYPRSIQVVIVLADRISKGIYA